MNTLHIEVLKDCPLPGGRRCAVATLREMPGIVTQEGTPAEAVEAMFTSVRALARVGAIASTWSVTTMPDLEVSWPTLAAKADQ